MTPAERVVAVEVRAVTNQGTVIAHDHHVPDAGYHETGLKAALTHAVEKIIDDAKSEGLL